MFSRIGTLACLTLLAACGSAPSEPIDSDGLGVSEIAVWDESAWLPVTDVTSPASTHPYKNRQRQRWTVSAPRCAEAMRLRFSRIGLEPGYDFLLVKDEGGKVIQRVTGVRDDFVTQPVPGRTINLELTTDASITGYGFATAAVQFIAGPVMCPAIAYERCPLDQVDVNGPPGACACPTRPTCESLEGFSAQLVTSGGITGQGGGHQVDGHGDIRLVADVVAATPVARAEQENVQELVRSLISSGFFELPGDLGTPRNMTSHFVASFRGVTRRLTWPVGALPGEMSRFQGAIDLFQKMVMCGGEGGATCHDGFVCDAGQCVERADVTCANVRCGFGTTCEMIDGSPRCVASEPRHGCEAVLCAPGTTCRLREVVCVAAPCYPQPVCVAQDEGCVCTREFAPVCGMDGRTYGNTCGAFCAGVHVAHEGACAEEPQTWRREAARLGSGSPYRNDQHVGWRVQGDVGTTGVRVHFSTFDLEAGYDFVVLYDAAWTEVARYSGTLGAFTSDVVEGNTAYVVFTSDASIVRSGFDVDYVEYH